MYVGVWSLEQKIIGWQNKTICIFDVNPNKSINKPIMELISSAAWAELEIIKPFQNL